MDRAPGDRLVGQLESALLGGPSLRLAVLFGSQARGRSRPDSDVDVGIVPDDPALSLRCELDLQARLERSCGRPVHLVRLDRASTLLRWEAARHGIRIGDTSRDEHARFVARAALEYAELAPALRHAEETFRERLGGGASERA
jgi:predicted nucleotidyltransferase